MIQYNHVGPKNSLSVHHFHCEQLLFETAEDTESSLPERNTVDIFYGTEGTVCIAHTSGTHILHANDMLVLPVRESYSLNAMTDNAKMLRIRLLPDVLYSIHHNVFEIKYILPFTSKSKTHQIFFNHETLKDSPIKECMRIIFAEYKKQACCFEVSVKIQIYSIFLWIARYWYEKGEMSDTINDISRGALNKLDFVLEYIEQNYSAHLQIEKLAYSVGFSYSYFAKMFKAGTGYNFTEYVNNLRLKHAERMMLEKPEAPITYIAMECGFNSTSYFIHLFKQKKGVTPNEFKKRQGL